MLTLIYGTQSAREAMYEKIRSDAHKGRRAYLIVPDQKALLAESALMRILPPSAALTTDAVGFSRLANIVCRKYGKLSYSYASDSAKIIFLYRALRHLRPALKVYGRAAGTDTLRTLCTLFSEFRACSVTPDDLANAASHMPSSPLRDKLDDLALLFLEYERLLHQRFSEQADDLDTLCNLLAEYNFFDEASVYIDSFVSFTKQEMTVISRMLSANVNVTVTLPYTVGGAHTAEAADTRRKLMRLAAKHSVKFDELRTIDKSCAVLRFAKDNIWNFSCCETYENSTAGALEIVRCADRNSEAQLCSREIFKAVYSGASYSDIAIILRRDEDYAGVLDRSLELCGIPFFFSKKTDAALLPLTKLISCALALHIYDFKLSDVVSYIKTGLCGFSDEESDLFEEYIDRWNINGRRRYLDGEDFTMSKDGYAADEPHADSLAEINSIKQRFAAPLSRFCDTLSGARTVRDFAAAVYEYLTEMNIGQASTDPSFTRFFGVDRTADAIRLWNMTMEALDILVETAGDEETTALEFSDLLQLLFSSIEIGNIPSSRDQVIIGGADTIRIDERKIILILGANEGTFPAPVPESPTLGESERNRLLGFGIELSQNRELRSSRELYHFVSALDFAKERVVIAYHTANPDGSASERSFAVERLEKLFGSNLCTYDFDALPPMEQIFYPIPAASAVGIYDSATESALKKVLEQRGLYTPPAHGKERLQNTAVQIPPDTAACLFGDRMRLSQTKLDTYADCRLRYFLRHMAKLTDTKPFEFNPADTGTFVHSILEQFLTEAKQDGRQLADYTKDQLHEAATRLCMAQTEKILRSSAGGSARMLSFFTRLQKNVELILCDLCEEFANSKFEPFLFEYKIGMGDGHRPLEIELSDGGAAMLCGIADRVDICRQNGKVYVRIVDYKTGKKSFKEEDILNGRNLQLLIYLFTLCKIADKGFFSVLGITDSEQLLPAGAVYFVVRAPHVRREMPPDGDMFDAARSELRREGILLSEEDIAAALDSSNDGNFSSKLIPKTLGDMDDLFESVKTGIRNAAENMRAGKFDCADTAGGSASPCIYCEYAAICRGEKTKGEVTDA